MNCLVSVLAMSLWGGPVCIRLDHAGCWTSDGLFLLQPGSELNGPTVEPPGDLEMYWLFLKDCSGDESEAFKTTGTALVIGGHLGARLSRTMQGSLAERQPGMLHWKPLHNLSAAASCQPVFSWISVL